MEYESSTGRLQLRLPLGTLAELRDAARAAGVTVSEFTRRAIQAEIRGRSTREIARLVAEEVVVALEPKLEGLGQTATEPERPFDRGCIDVDLHYVGRRCSSCGGSF